MLAIESVNSAQAQKIKSIDMANTVGTSVGVISSFLYADKIAGLSVLSKDEFTNLKSKNRLPKKFSDLNFDEFKGAVKLKAQKIFPSMVLRFFGCVLPRF